MQITEYAAEADELFRCGKEARVHSAYKNTVNVMTDVGLFSLQTADVPLTPMCVVLDCSAAQLARLIETAQTVRFHQQGFLFGSTAVPMSRGCRVYCGALKKAGRQGPSISDCRNSLLKVLQHAAPQESMFLTLSEGLWEDSVAGRTAKTAHEVLCDAKTNMKSDGAAAAKVLSGLLGLGPGLTPAGDDFLLGVLAACDLVSQEESVFCKNLVRQLGKASAETNAVSARFLDFACRREYADALRAALQGMLDGVSEKTLCALLLRAAAIGHSSGSDALSGVLWYLNLLEEGENNGSLQ